MDEINEQAGTAMGSGEGRPFVAPAPEELNRVLPNFEVECLIGQGGMGAVYKARQPKLDRFVAIKVVPALLGRTEHNFAERFAREARAMAGLSHPNIVTVHDFGETENGYLYIVMEYVDGRDMHHAIVSGRTGLNEALVWMTQLCGAIQYAHDHDIVHRDIKPANILINSEGLIKVGDFGLVKLVGRKLETALTRTQVAMGTPDYSAPEALDEGGTVDHRADVYSLGVLFYELLTGKVPRGAWKPPSALVPLNPRLDQIVVKAMQPDPEQRYQSAAQLKEAIEAVIAMGAQEDVKVVGRAPTEGEAVPAARRSPPGEKTRVKRMRKRESPVAQALVALLLIGIAVGAFAAYQNQKRILDYFAERKRLAADEAAATQQKQENAVPEAERTAAGGGGEAASALRIVRAEEGWVDVVPSLQFPRDLVSGRWGHQGGVLMPRNQRDADRSRLRIPMLLEPNFEVALEVVYKQSIVPFVLTLPLRAGPVPLLIGESGLPNEPPFLAIGAGGPLRNGIGKGEAIRRFPIKLGPSSPHSFSVRVVNRGDEAGILVTVDGEETGRFLGTLSDIAPGGDKTDVLSRHLVLGATGDLEIRNFRVRSLPAEDWLPELPRKSVARKTPGAPEMGPKQAPVKPRSAQEEQELAWTETAKQRIAEVGATFEKRELDFARANYDVEVANLREKYNAALNRAILEDGSIPVKAAVQRELMRVREGELVEATDPPEMPEIVKKARAIYRQELAKLDEQLNLALAPMLREHAQSLSVLESDLTAAGQCPAAARTLLVEARSRVERRLEEVRAFLDALEKSRKPEQPDGEAGKTMAQEENGKGEPAAAAAVVAPAGVAPVVPRKEVLKADKRAKGRIEVWPRAETGREVAVKGEWEDVPSGLGNTVVAITGSPGAAVALKSTGRVVIWGSLVTEALREEVGRIDDVVEVAVATTRTWIGLGFLLEDGSARFFPELAALAGSTPGAKVSDLVEVAVLPELAVGLRQSGEMAVWGRAPVFQPGSGAGAGLARLFAHPTRLVGLGTQGSLLGWVGGKPEPVEISPDGPFQEAAVGTQPQFGMVAQRMDGGVVALGSFASAQVALQAYVTGRKIVRLVAGFDAFAVQEEGGAWAFFGSNLDVARLEKAARGCRDLVIGKDEVIGLQSM